MRHSLCSNLTARIASKLTTLRPKKRSFHAKVYYECSPFAVPKVELALLERSLANGCRGVLTRSCSHLDQIYDLLVDLQDEDSAAPHVGHVLHCPPPHVLHGKSPEQVGALLREKWLRELRVIEEHFAGTANKLEFLSLQIPTSLFAAPGHSAAVQDLVCSVQNWESRVINSNTFFALDFSTQTFASFESNVDAEQMVSILQSMHEKTRDIVIRGTTVATNGHTFHYAHMLANQLRNNLQMKVLATEVLRCDVKRPGQLSAHYDFHPHHRVEESASAESETANNEEVQASKEEKDLIRQIHHATDDFKRALDRCIQVEKVLLDTMQDKLAEKKLTVTQFCLAHVLMKTHQQFSYPEEWDYIVHHQINPQFESSLDVMLAANKELRDWASLYKPLGKYLLASFRHFLQVKTLRHAQQAIELINSKTNKRRVLADLPNSLAMCAQHFLPADAVGLTLTKIDMRDPTFANMERNAAALNEDSPTEFYHRLRTICQSP